MGFLGVVFIRGERALGALMSESTPSRPGIEAWKAHQLRATFFATPDALPLKPEDGGNPWRRACPKGSRIGLRAVNTLRKGHFWMGFSPQASGQIESIGP